MKKFEYKILYIKDWSNINNDRLNKYGKDGWELVSVVYSTDGTRFIFKKELQ